MQFLIQVEVSEYSTAWVVEQLRKIKFKISHREGVPVLLYSKPWTDDGWFVMAIPNTVNSCLEEFTGKMTMKDGLYQAAPVRTQERIGLFPFCSVDAARITREFIESAGKAFKEHIENGDGTTVASVKVDFA